uniref:Uncharacterized protein n=1 Tax=Ciona intestinalis TaxID=7719 RepID=H2Y2V3_CIOIN
MFYKSRYQMQYFKHHIIQLPKCGIDAVSKCRITSYTCQSCFLINIVFLVLRIRL